MENSNDNIGNLTRDLPTCSAVIFKINPPKLTANLNNGLLLFVDSQPEGK